MMSQASTPQMRDVAKRLMAYETGITKRSGTETAVAFHCCEKLRSRLTILMGDAGYRALLSRLLASSEVPWLHAVHVNTDGSLEGLEELDAQLAPAEFFEGRVVLLAQLLGTLVAFIGEDVTLGLVREAWPQVPLNGYDFSKGHEDEQTK